MKKSYEVLIIEDEPVIGLEIEAFLVDSGFRVRGIAKNAEAARQLFTFPYPDAVILDINLGNDDGVALAAELDFAIHVPLIYLTAHGDSNTIQRARETRPTSYLLKPFNEKELFAALEIGIYNHIGQKASGKTIDMINEALPNPLTKRELAVVEELMNGKSNREIAEALFVSIHTVKSQMQTIFSKFDVKNRTELMFRLHEHLA